MYNSDIAIYSKQMDYYLEISKFGKLAAWILNSLGADIDNIEDLIGEPPELGGDRELTQDDLDLIGYAKQNNLNYKITNKGIKITV